MNELQRYYSSPASENGNALDRYIDREIQWQITQRKIAAWCIFIIISITPAYLAWGFGRGAGEMAAWIIYRFILYLAGWGLAGLALFTMWIVGMHLVRFIQSRRY